MGDLTEEEFNSLPTESGALSEADFNAMPSQPIAPV